jgi:hypothetical protein
MTALALVFSIAATSSSTAQEIRREKAAHSYHHLKKRAPHRAKTVAPRYPSDTHRWMERGSGSSGGGGGSSGVGNY